MLNIRAYYQLPMDYIDLFLKDKRPRKLSKLEQLIVTHSVVKEIFVEVLDTSYRPRLNELYCEEDKVIQMLDLIVQTPIYRGFQWMYGIELHGVDKIPCMGGAMLELSKSAQPCANLRVLPYVGDRVNEFIARLTGCRGWYARVVTPGRINRYDPLVRF